MVSQTIKDKFCNEMNKQMVNDGMYEALLPHFVTEEKVIFHVGNWLESNLNEYNRERLVSVLDYSEEYGFMERIFAGKKTKRIPFHWQEIAVISEKVGTVSRNCYYRDFGMTRGLSVYGYDGKKKHINSGSWYYADYDYMEHLEFSWLESKHFYYREEMFGMDKIAELDPSVKYCAWNPESGIYFIDYVKLYRKYPIGEMLMKLGLYRMIKESAMEKIQNDKAFQKWLFRNAKECRSLSFGVVYNSFRKNPELNPQDYANSLFYRQKCGRELATVYKDTKRRLYKYTTPERICEYLEKNSIGTASYMDYIRAAEWLQLDFTDTKVLFPHNFQEVHDSYTEQFFQYEIEKEVERQNARRTTLNKEIKEMAEKFNFLSWEHEGFRVIVAASKEDLIYEGKLMENCVGKMEYDKRMARGESIICFIRKTESPNVPYITAQVNADTLNIMQFYGKGNSVIKEMDEWKKAWIKHSKTARKRIKEAA